MAGMSEMNRRDFGIALAMFGALGGQIAKGQEVAAGAGTMGASRVFLPALKTLPNGVQRWAGPQGAIATGETVSVHESVVPAGTPRTDAHVIKHSELVIVVAGMIHFEHDGVVDKVPAGAVAYVAYGTTHLMWNPGEVEARYFVVQLGGDIKKA
jgi:mannose-6-phosphate isomerase-like protein (cupin superfamily)